MTSTGPGRRRSLARPVHRRERGAMALVVVTVGGGLIATLALATLGLVSAGIDLQRAQGGADAAAHAAEGAVLGAPPWTEEDLSREVGIDPSRCALSVGRPVGDLHPLCVAALGRALSVVAAQPAETRLLDLVVGPDARDERSGRGPTRLEVIAVVAVRRGLPLCRGATPPGADGAGSPCWVVASAAAHAT